MGRAVIAMTAVRIRARVEPGKVTGQSDIRPPTDVMAITSLPYAPTNHPVSGFPLSVYCPPPATWGCHLPLETYVSPTRQPPTASRFRLLPHTHHRRMRQ